MKKLYPLYFLSLLVFFCGSCSTQKTPKLSNNSPTSVNLLTEQDSLSVKSEPLIDSTQQKLTNTASVNVKTTEETEEKTTTPDPDSESSKRKFRVKGEIPPESWNRLGTKLIAKLRSSSEGLKVEISLEASAEAAAAKSLVDDLRQTLDHLSASDRVEAVEE